MFSKSHGAKHIVPLANQTVSILRNLQPLTGRGRYVFPNSRRAHVPISDTAIPRALRSIGYAKGRTRGYMFRAAARNMLDEVLGESPELIEIQLGHRVRDRLDLAYSRANFLSERRAMMQKWADFCDQLKAGTLKS